MDPKFAIDIKQIYERGVRTNGVKYNGGDQSRTDTCVSHYDYDTQDL